MLRIEFRKGNESDLLLCTREDGSTTWMETTPFATVHDLVHYVVEKHLNFKSGFYGLVESGLNVSDIEERLDLRKNKLPAEAGYAENLVSLFTSDLQHKATVNDFQRAWTRACKRLAVPRYPIDEIQITTIREEINELIRYWDNMAEKKSLELVF
jgi:hypothetical protein